MGILEMAGSILRKLSLLEGRRINARFTMFFLVDPPNNDSMPCGIIPDVFPTADFWPGTPEQMDKSIAVQQYYAKGMYVEIEGEL